jgi:metallo-beta-lactamase family protein
VVRAEIASIDAFSGHADRSELTDYVKSLTGDIRKVTVIHGEEEQSLAFAGTLRELKPRAEVIVPEPGQIVEFSMESASPAA